jgi:hypothetical protein
MSASDWFLKSPRSEKTFGPVTLPTIIANVSAGKAKDSHLIRRGDWNTWISVGEARRRGLLTDEVDAEAVPSPVAESGLVRMVSGREYQFTHVLLYDTKLINRTTALRSQAEANLKGFSIGFGIIGSVGEVLTAALVMGAIEDLVGKQMTKTAMRQLESYYRLIDQTRNSGRFIPVRDIQNIAIPTPEMWRFVHADADGQCIGSYGFNGDPFVALRTTDGVVTVTWSHVEGYVIISA